MAQLILILRQQKSPRFCGGICILLKNKICRTCLYRLLSFLGVFFLELVNTSCSIYQHFLTGKERM